MAGAVFGKIITRAVSIINFQQFYLLINKPDENFRHTPDYSNEISELPTVPPI